MLQSVFFLCVLVVRSLLNRARATMWRTVATRLNQLSSYVPPPPREAEAAPRRVLVVDVHPLGDSFSAAIADAVVQGAKEGGHACKRRSLYAEGFQPALSASERSRYFDCVAKNYSDDVKSHLADLRWCDSVVFVYPTWWFNMPAMLKGYFDRTLVPGDEGAWAFPGTEAGETVASNGLVPRLTNVQRVMGVSTYGASRSLVLLAGDNGRNCISTGIRANFSPDCACHWLGLYDMDFASSARRREFLDAVRTTVAESF